MNLQRISGFGVLFLIFLTCSLCYANVYELTKDNLDTFRKGKLLVVIFIDSPTCTRCRIQYPFFVATSQAFPSDPEVFFARVHDPRLVHEWGIAELPALMYYRHGLEEPDFFMVDVTVDNIIDEIARRLHGNFGGLDRFYATEVTSSNYQEIVKTPKQNVLLLTYDKNSKDQVKVMEQAARVFRNDDAILICKLNVDKYEELRDREFRSRDVPAVYWFKEDDKQSPKRFGGHISIHMQTSFINEQTGLGRNPDGSMKPTSGQVVSYNSLILDHADGILKGDKDDIGKVVSLLQNEKSKLKRHELEWSAYYIFLLEKMQSSGNMDVLQTQLDDITLKLIEQEDLLPKQEDLLRRKRNILRFFTNLPKENERLKKEREEKRRKEEEEREKREMEEEELRKRQEIEERFRHAAASKTTVIRKKKDRTSEYTAKATLHRRVHEEL